MEKGQRKLSKKELQRFVGCFKRVGRKGIESTEPALLHLLEQEVQVDLPTGELCNPAITPLLMAWQWGGQPLVPGEITAWHQFNANGLEGLVSVRMRLAMALLTAMKVDLYRIDVFVPASWKGGAYAGQGEPESEEEDDETGET